jgi:hypothetical protein
MNTVFSIHAPQRNRLGTYLPAVAAQSDAS